MDEHTNNAYAHAVIGKWHLSRDANHPTNMGVGYYAGFLHWSTISQLPLSNNDNLVYQILVEKLDQLRK